MRSVSSPAAHPELTLWEKSPATGFLGGRRRQMRCLHLRPPPLTPVMWRESSALRRHAIGTPAWAERADAAFALHQSEPNSRGPAPECPDVCSASTGLRRKFQNL